ncbi:MAG TPA: hypothetical protein VFE50_03505 [Cyclobacteriaceae bacterium]|nr:hypothetical protein [Cyclobacteriaceae bacterium]
MKKAILLFVLLAISTFTFAQKKSKKLTTEESSKMTSDQRYVHESTRKSKSGKKDLSLKKKIRTEEKQDRKARKIKKGRKRY